MENIDVWYRAGCDERLIVHVTMKLCRSERW